ncbi:hypothetical protein [Rhodococcus sp. PD04]|uniref:hypothetical protein n=1 Tax=Rhodococcus sp. PD04 TaxID=3109594 RepID=UPI002DDC686A|nr:hypothetical protein [Rhodococcus sp. PD04]WSE22339.1 hypothetical protein U9J23_22240 [Rhodococcus sp. PD04]
MNKVRKIFVAVLVLVAFLLAGCGASFDDGAGNETPGWIKPHYVNLPDGRVVLCVWEGDAINGGGGVSCDWTNAKRDPIMRRARS